MRVAIAIDTIRENIDSAQYRGVLLKKATTESIEKEIIIKR